MYSLAYKRAFKRSAAVKRTLSHLNDAIRDSYAFNIYLVIKCGCPYLSYGSRQTYIRDVNAVAERRPAYLCHGIASDTLRYLDLAAAPGIARYLRFVLRNRIYEPVLIKRSVMGIDDKARLFTKVIYIYI